MHDIVLVNTHRLSRMEIGSILLCFLLPPPTPLWHEGHHCRSRSLWFFCRLHLKSMPSSLTTDLLCPVEGNTTGWPPDSEPEFGVVWKLLQVKSKTGNPRLFDSFVKCEKKSYFPGALLWVFVLSERGDRACENGKRSHMWPQPWQPDLRPSEFWNWTISPKSLSLLCKHPGAYACTDTSHHSWLSYLQLTGPTKSSYSSLQKCFSLESDPLPSRHEVAWVWVHEGSWGIICFLPVMYRVFNHVRDTDSIFFLLLIVVIHLKNRLRPHCNFYIAWIFFLPGYLSCKEKNRERRRKT